MYGVLLVAVLVVMGGAIAYIGDKLGTKVGKKKLSVFGMRPKHTSILVTIITGIFITAATLGVMALASENVRVALFGMERLNRQIYETETALHDITAQLDQAKDEHEKTLTALERTQADYRTALGDLDQSRTQIVALEGTKAELAAQKGALESRVAALSGEQERLESDIDRLKVLTQRLSESIQFVRKGDIVYRSGEVILSSVLRYRADQEQLGGDLAELLRQANREILLRLGIAQEIEAIWISQEDYARAVQSAHEAGGDTLVRVVAAGNIIYGEPVRASILLFPNQLVYRADQLIYREDFVLHGGEGEQLILGFLKQVNAAATKHGIMPDPLRGTVGVMDGAQFYEIVNSLEPLQGNIRITALAREDTHAAGPLRLRIKIEQLP